MIEKAAELCLLPRQRRCHATGSICVEEFCGAVRQSANYFALGVKNSFWAISF
jgi:hypothetical protein